MLRDIKNIIFKPTEAFYEIKDRGLILPSFVLYIIIEALGIILHFPLEKTEKVEIITKIPSFIGLPLGFFLWTGIIHLISKRYSLNGSYRNLLSVWGYTCIPYLFSLLAFPILYLLDPDFEKLTIYTIVGIAFVIFVSIAMFIWSIILLIIAIRIVYKFTLKRVLVILVIFFVIGSIFESIFVSFNETFLFQSYPSSVFSVAKEYEDGIFFTKDKVSYLFREPKPGNMIVFVQEKDINKKPICICISVIGENTPIHSWIIGGCKEYIGKIEEKKDDLFLVFYQEKKVLVKKEQVKGRVCGFVSVEELEKK
ncbi:TPA: hypothetical protein DCX16_01450 [bacterium]|nr:hypothetical protein [bacterium]